MHILLQDLQLTSLMSFDTWELQSHVTIFKHLCPLLIELDS
jgi:hypothetical protein